MLGNGDVEALETLSLRKRDLVRQLESLAEETDSSLADVGLPGLGAPDWPAGRHGLEEVTPLRERLHGLLGACRDRNSRNGGAIRALMGFNRRALDVLHGAADTPAIYGPSGESRPLSGSRYAADA